MWYMGLPKLFMHVNCLWTAFQTISIWARLHRDGFVFFFLYPIRHPKVKDLKYALVGLTGYFNSSSPPWDFREMPLIFIWKTLVSNKCIYVLSFFLTTSLVVNHLDSSRDNASFELCGSHKFWNKDQKLNKTNIIVCYWTNSFKKWKLK